VERRYISVMELLCFDSIERSKLTNFLSCLFQVSVEPKETIFIPFSVLAQIIYSFSYES
jgi:hypothetical protein